MTEKRFDIVVQDKVARTIKEELAAIGNASKGARGFIAQLKAEMATLSSAQGGMAGAATAATRSFRDEAAAANAARTALADQRREAELLTRALNDQAQAARAAAAASAANGRGQPFGPPAPGPNGGAGGQGGNGGNGGAGGGGSRSGSSSNLAGAARSIREIGEQSKLSTQYAAQLGFQLNDIGVSLASGQKPLTVFIQQGAQIAQIPAQAGLTWKQFGTQVAGTLGVVKRTGDAALDAAAAQAATAAAAVAAANSQAAANVRVAETEVALATAQQSVAVTANEQALASARLTAANEALATANSEAAITTKALESAQGKASSATSAASAASTTRLSGLARAGIAGAAAAAVLATTIGILNHEANEGDKGLKKYADGMGYTAKEIKKLNAVQVTWGDTTKALFKEIGDDIQKDFANAFGMSMTDVKKYMKDAMGTVIEWARKGLAGLYALIAGTKSYLDELSKGGLAGFGNILMGGDPDLLKRTYGKAFTDADNYLKDLGGRTIETARGYARKRQDELAKELYNKPREKKARQGWDREKELRNENAALDAQIALLGKYGDELERANQLEQIAKKFRDHSVPLTAAENAQLERKIQLLQEGRRIQEAMTAIDEAANGAERKYTDSLQALNKLRETGKITADQYAEQLRLITRAFDDATNPLAQYNRELQKTGELMGLYGRDRDVQAYIQQLEESANAMGKSIYEQPTGTSANDNEITVNGKRKRKLTPEAQDLVDEYKRQQEQSAYTQWMEAHDRRQKYQDPNDPSYILDKYKEMYAEIDRMRKEGVISEQEAADRKAEIDSAYLAARLSNTSNILGQLSVLQKAKNKEVAAFGKAAAMTQATIDGIAAVQAALRGPPGPPWSYAIAAATGVAAAANVAKIAGIGFMSGGYTGNGATNEVAGAVHGQEFVFDAAATKRIGVPALEAMRKGNLSQPANNNTIGGSRVVIKPQPGVYVEERRTSTDEIELIASRVVHRDAPTAVANDIRRGSNGRTGRALGSSYGLKRTDR